MRQQVTKEMKNKWGSYPDRKNSYDDDSDCEIFIEHTKNNRDLQNYILRYINSCTSVHFHMKQWPHCRWKIKPDGKHGIDLALVNDDKRLLHIDVERWSEWKGDWPPFYKNLHFFGRKDHFLEDDPRFIIVYMNYERNKLIVVNKDVIKRYETKNKYFRHKKCYDWVKEMKMSDGHIFGYNITPTERRNFA
tara:strand:- start:289 stop:861 length:573 start_codon:yes stop_codon:yes gene_type:complete